MCSPKPDGHVKFTPDVEEVVNNYFKNKRLSKEVLRSVAQASSRNENRRRSETVVKHHSAFSSVYLDDHTRDLLSLRSGRASTQMEVLSSQSPIVLNQREQTHRAVSLIGNLQSETAELQKKRGFKDDRMLLNRLVGALQQYQIDVQKLNGLRFECLR